MQRNQYKQNLALANCTYINISFFTITFNFFHINPSTILFITSSFSLYFFFLKKCLLDLQLVLLKQRLEYHAPKKNKAKRKLPYKLFKIVCSKVQHWLVGRLFVTNVVSFNEWMWHTVAKLPRWCAEVLGVHRMGQRPRTHVSREHWRYFISLVLRLRVSNNISSTPFSYLLSFCHCLSSTSKAMIWTHG